GRGAGGGGGEEGGMRGGVPRRGRARAVGPAPRESRQRVLGRLRPPPFATGGTDTRERRRLGLIRLLDWLEQQPGDCWQQRWVSGGADAAGEPGRGGPSPPGGGAAGQGHAQPPSGVR